MNKDLKGHLQLTLHQLLLNPPQIVEAQLPRQNHALAAQLLGHGNTGSASDGHLGRAVDSQLRGELLGQCGKANVLDDESVDSGSVSGQQ